MSRRRRTSRTTRLALIHNLNDLLAAREEREAQIPHRNIRIGLHGDWRVTLGAPGWRPGRAGVVFRVDAPDDAPDDLCAWRAICAWRADSPRPPGWRVKWDDRAAALLRDGLPAGVSAEVARLRGRGA